MEEWLASATRVSRGGLTGEGEQGVPAYAEAVLEHTAEGLDDLVRILRHSEENREAATAAGTALADRLGALTETIRDQQNLLAQLAEQSNRIAGTVDRLHEGAEGGDRQAGLAHQRNIEALLTHLVEESARNRASVAEELRGAVGQLAGRLDGTDNAALLAHQRNIEALLAHLVEENARGRAALSEELRGIAERSSARPDTTSDDALRMHQRSIEALLARLIEDSARNRSLLAEELRGEFRLLARAIAAPARRDAGRPSQGEG